jgi:GTPase SAR1 family protein
MKISNYISIDTVYTRSINIERDSESSKIVNAYIPTSRAVNVLYRISEAFDLNNTPRSWALIGPYGSGKSSFAVFLSHLMSDKKNPSTTLAHEILKKTDDNLCNKFINHTKNSKGYLSILINGTPEPLSKRFLQGMYDAACKYWQNVGRKPAILDRIKLKFSEPKVTTTEIIELFEDLQKSVRKSGSGIIVIFDEFGKFLEYEARHYGVNDVYILQLLSELALKDNSSKLFIFTLMHQSFEEYSRGLSKTLRNEWNKIQGRFETVPFLESTEQIINVLSKAFVNECSQEIKVEIFNRCFEIAQVLYSEAALPGKLETRKAAGLFSNCYPLHPVSIILLPILCQKMAQNERTLFSYLGSRESYGFNDCLNKLESTEQWVMPWQIYEYFIQNQPSVTTDPIAHRRWAEVVSAVERLGDAKEQDIQLLKTIGLFNILGAQSGFKASKEIIALCFPDKKSLDISINNLFKKSVIQFRKFSNEYRVWQGSDFDLEEAVKKELSQLGHFELSSIIDEIKSLQPIVAHRHSIENVTLRYFIPSFVDVNNYNRLKPKDSKQRLIFCLTETPEETELAENRVINYFGQFDIIAIYSNGEQLRQAVGEVLALKRVEQNCPELNTDPIAKKEFKDRFFEAENLQENLLSDLVESPHLSTWFWKKNKVFLKTKRELQRKLSEILDSIYFNSPVVKNELINREKPSAQASAARNKLVFAMLHNIEKEDLGIDKFPAEKGIYKSFLKATGLHRLNKNNKWELAPPSEGNPYNLFPVWKCIESFLERTVETPQSFSELDDVLQAPPYGVKLGIIPLLYLTVFLCRQKELAFYENGIYTPYITDQHIERFMKRPDIFSVQLLKISGIRASLFKSYSNVLYGENHNKDINLLSITKPLAKFVNELEEYTKNTNRLSNQSQKALKAFDLATSPADLLFNKLPKACSFPEISPDETNENKIKGFTNALINVIKELRDAYKNMLEEFVELLSSSLLPDCNDMVELKIVREKIRSRYEGLQSFTVDSKGLRPFIEYITSNDGDDNVWFNRLLLFLGGKSSKKWTDIDRDNAVLRLTEYSKKLLDLRIIQDHFIKNKAKFNDSFEIIRLRTSRLGKYDSENDEIITIDPMDKNFIDKYKSEFYSLLDKFKDDESRIAILADIIDEYLSAKKSNNKKQNGKISNG